MAKEDTLSQEGTTLIEVIVYAGLLSAITIACYQFYQLNICTYRIEKVKSELFQDLRMAVSMISKDIRLCGCDPLNSGNLGFINEPDNKDRYDTDINSIHMSADLVYPWDGKATAINEEVLYFLYPQTKGRYKLGRCTGKRRTPQPVAENILSLVFRYYDLSGKILPDPPFPLTAIASVEVSITAQALQPNPITRRMDTLSFQTRVWVRNNSL
ncbi:MAG: hypothetical protein HQK75_06910 [Candidatus Magnetomorum sp.]|nr:hypothetical protein [Candidatus Magnetomorum sp.]